MPNYPLSTLGPTIDATGIAIPSYNDVYQSLIASFQQIYGSDIIVTPDSQDGQWLATLAKAISDVNNAAVSVFNSFSPNYSQGVALSSLVKLNGLTRNIATNSQAVGTVTGTVGTTILSGVVQDVNGNLWDLPVSVTIPAGGSVAVTVTAQQAGTIAAPIGTINKIYNPQLGWQTFSNTVAATEGLPIETDAALRSRQAISTSLPSQAIVTGIDAAIGNVVGVIRHITYENATATTDGNGVPAHTIYSVVEGGAVADIANAIYLKKPPGIQTYGTTSYTVTDPTTGLPSTINFYALTEVTIYFAITIKALAGYVASTATAIQNALVSYVTGLAIGESVYATQAQAVAQLNGLGLGQTFYITAFKLDTVTPPVNTGNVTIAFNQAATTTAANITITQI